MNDANCAITKEEKHIKIYQSSERLEEAVDNLGFLIDKIQGSGLQEDTNKQPVTTPTLLSVLDDTSDMMNHQCNRIDDMICQLKSILY